MRRPPSDEALRARDERLEALKAVVGKLAHDFNNFLVPQFGYVTLLQDEVPAGSTGSQYISRMEAAGRSAEKYIESILLGMRPHRQFNPREFSFDLLLHSALDQWDGNGATGISLRREIEPGTVFGDDNHWRNALVQLLANARFALATGGNLAVRLQRLTLDSAEVERLGLDRKEVLCLSVRDDGFGMADSVADRAFEPFFTTRSPAKAAGLGLTIVHSVTHFQGGQVELDTVEEKGTTITVWIPLGVVVPKEQRSPVDRSLEPRLHPKKMVLLLEEDPLANEVLCDWFRRFEFDVQPARSFDDAIRLFETRAAEWALVVTETDLHEHRGEELFERLHPLNRTVPWIFLAGHRKPELNGEIKGPVVLQKPFTMRSFAEMLQTHAAK